MTGPEHYREAERLISGPDVPSATGLAWAQVHATLALAAATALPGDTEGVWPAWRAVAS